MQFGMPTLIENESLTSEAALCRELGLDFIELNMNFPRYQLENIGRIVQMQEVKEKYGIYYTIHLDENMNVCDFNDRVAKAYRDMVQETIQAAKALEIPVLNMHTNPGVHVTLPDRKVQLFEQYKEEYQERVIGFRDMCTKEIGEAPVKISVENTGGYAEFQKEAIELLLESSVFALTWDIGHSQVTGNVDEPFLMRHQERLCHFHIHDVTGTKDHRPLGTGETDLKQRLAVAARHTCRCVVETKTVEALRTSVGWLKDRNYLSV